MATIAHFIDVGQGNMTLLELSDGKIMLYDCNVTEDNEDEVLGYLAKVIGLGSTINVFINSHRDADHMRGVKKVHDSFPISHVWDSGVTGGTPDSREYRDYMDLRRRVGFTVVERLKKYEYGQSLLRIFNSKNSQLAKNGNAQSIVIKVQHRTVSGGHLSSLLLTGDTDAITWKDSIIPTYQADVKTDILLGSHHGSITFFDDPSNQTHYYVDHMKKISPSMTILSVGNNAHGHPDDKAIELYNTHSTGSNKGNKIRRTDKDGHIKLVLEDRGGWKLNIDQ